MGLALCFLIFAYCEKFKMTGARQVGYIAGPLRTSNGELDQPVT